MTALDHPKLPKLGEKRRREASASKEEQYKELQKLLHRDAPNPAELGLTSLHVESLVSGGPEALLKAEHESAKLAKRFGEEIEAEWMLQTPMLVQMLQSGQRVRARYALKWRPRFLAALSLTNSVCAACRAAKVNYRTARWHRENDEHFSRQCDEAEERAVQLLVDSCWRSAIEGDLKPIFWQGIQCGFVREYDGKLRIEMLRAYRPAKFKTPGAAPINIDNRTSIFVMDAETQQALIAKRRAALLRMQENNVTEATVAPSEDSLGQNSSST
ncbi:MAG: hypothetical protein ACXV2F_06715 [Halobacteriota archaeon]